MNLRRTRILLTAALVFAGAGAIDAAIGEHWDQFAVLVAVAACCLAAGWLNGRTRAHLTVRSDLGRWLRRRSAIEGEPVDVLADRAIATYRDHLVAGADTLP